MNSNIKHIVFLTPGFASSEEDTSTIPAIQVYFKALKKVFPELKITIIAFQFPFTNKSYNWHGCSVIPLNGKNKITHKLFVWNRAYKALSKINKKNQITLIHSFWLSECAFIGYWFSKKNHIPHITTLMGQDVLKKNYYLKLLPLKSMQFICISTIQRQHLHRSVPIQPKIIPWGIDPKECNSLSKKTIDIIGVGSLIPLKNFELFIDVIYELNKIKPLKVILIGDGIQKEFLQKKIHSLQLENAITLTGLLPYEETLSSISKAKVLLHTSNYEGFGMIFAEALQCKTMIVSKEVGCAYSTENWTLCETKIEMVNACKKSLIKPFSDQHLNPYTIEKTVTEYLKFYSSQTKIHYSLE